MLGYVSRQTRVNWGCGKELKDSRFSHGAVRLVFLLSTRRPPRTAAFNLHCHDGQSNLCSVSDFPL